MSSILQCLGPHAQQKRMMYDLQQMTEHCWPPTKIEVEFLNEPNNQSLMCTQPGRRDQGHWLEVLRVELVGLRVSAA